MNLLLQLLRIAVGLLVESSFIIVFDLLEFVDEVKISSKANYCPSTKNFVLLIYGAVLN